MGLCVVMPLVIIVILAGSLLACASREQPSTTAGLVTAPALTKLRPVPVSDHGTLGCRGWTDLLDYLSVGARTESAVRLHFAALMQPEHFLTVEYIWADQFSRAVEPELRERGKWVIAASYARDVMALDGAATALTDACYHYGHNSPF